MNELLKKLSLESLENFVKQALEDFLKQPIEVLYNRTGNSKEIYGSFSNEVLEEINWWNFKLIFVEIPGKFSDSRSGGFSERIP